MAHNRLGYLMAILVASHAGLGSPTFSKPAYSTSAAKAQVAPLIDPPLIIALGKIVLDWALAKQAEAKAYVEANGDNDDDSDTITNLSNFFGYGEVELNLDAGEVKDGNARAKVEVDYLMPLAGRNGGWVKDSSPNDPGNFYALVDPGVPPPPKQHALATYTIAVDGQLIASDTIVAGGTEDKNSRSTSFLAIDPLQIRTTTVGELMSDPVNPLPGDLVFNLPESFKESTIIYGPNWTYWEPLVATGTTIESVYESIQSQLTDAGIPYVVADIKGNAALAQAAEADVPGPLPLLGVAAGFGYSRKLRKRIKGSKSLSLTGVID